MKNIKKEDEKINVELNNLGTVNQNCVVINKGGRQCNLYFSYSTIVSVDGVTSQNDWSTTTGKLLNKLCPDKKKRVPHSEVLKEADKRIKYVLYEK